MEQLSRLKARIGSLDDLRELMRAMRALAASNVQASQTALEGVRQYTGVIENAIAAGAALLPESDRVSLPVGDDSQNLLILIGSEHGFVGGYNERLFERALALRTADSNLALVGQRTTDLAVQHELKPIWTEPMATQVGAVLGVARRIAHRLAGVGRVQLINAGYRRGGAYEVEVHQVLPLNPALLARSRAHPPPLHQLPAELLLFRLADEYLVAELTRAIMEAFASENGARLRVMESADQNIDNRLQHLGSQVLSVRQAAITEELLDLMTGVEASLGVGR